jgi:hypothetical protein
LKSRYPRSSRTQTIRIKGQKVQWFYSDINFYLLKIENDILNFIS